MNSSQNRFQGGPSVLVLDQERKHSVVSSVVRESDYCVETFCWFGEVADKEYKSCLPEFARNITLQDRAGDVQECRSQSKEEVELWRG